MKRSKYQTTWERKGECNRQRCNYGPYLNWYISSNGADENWKITRVIEVNRSAMEMLSMHITLPSHGIHPPQYKGLLIVWGGSGRDICVVALHLLETGSIYEEEPVVLSLMKKQTPRNCLEDWQITYCVSHIFNLKFFPWINLAITWNICSQFLRGEFLAIHTQGQGSRNCLH